MSEFDIKAMKMVAEEIGRLRKRNRELENENAILKLAIESVHELSVELIMVANDLVENLKEDYPQYAELVNSIPIFTKLKDILGEEK
jgi:hypothetical protein